MPCPPSDPPWAPVTAVFEFNVWTDRKIQKKSGYMRHGPVERHRVAKP